MRRRVFMRRARAVVALAVAILCASPLGHAQKPAAKISDGVVKIGMLLDMSSLYADLTGEGSATAARMAIEDFGGKVLGARIELLYADHQNKADLASSKAREWFDVERVDILADVAASATALAALEVARQKNRIVMFSGPGATRLTNENCSPVSVHYTYDTYALAVGTGRGALKTGGDTWFFITADYAFGHTLEKDTSDIVKAGGGKVLGSVRHPLNAVDLSSFLLQAQSSKAKVIGLGNAGGDMVNAVKTANEFGIIASGQRIAGLLVFITDINSLGLRTAQGLQFTEAFYWDLNDDTRAWTKRFVSMMNGKQYPTMNHAGNYGGMLHFLKAIEAAQTRDGTKIVAKMKQLPTDD